METWKDIKNYEGLYQISNLGRVRSLKKWCGNKHLAKWGDRAKIMTPTDNGHGYLLVCLRKDSKRKNHYVHRLVATHFIDNAMNKRCVNHKNFNTHDNNVNNLEWVTQKENVEFSVEHMKHRKSVTHTNTGEKYITYRKGRNVYRVIISKKEYGSFKTLEEAIKNRDEILKNEGVV